jgi:hypothetical protein
MRVDEHAAAAQSLDDARVTRDRCNSAGARSRFLILQQARRMALLNLDRLVVSAGEACLPAQPRLACSRRANSRHEQPTPFVSISQSQRAPSPGRPAP